MSSHWKDEFSPLTGLITLVGERSYWDKTVCYGSLAQTLSQSDFNPSGSTETRHLARSLFASPEVKSVKLSGDTIFLTVEDGISLQKAAEITQTSINRLACLQIYDE